MLATSYQRLTHEEHIRLISDTYIGSDQKVPRKTRVLVEEDGKSLFRNFMLTLPEAIEHLFLEITSNAGDNVSRSREAGVPFGKVRVLMNDTQILVENGGLPIPVVMHPDYSVYVPEMIFGELLTSSNYTGDRTGAGRNGYGAKLVNLYSRKFSIEVADSTNGLLYTQEWEDLMRKRHLPVIIPYTKNKSYVKVLFELDLSRFGYEVFPEEAFSLFAAHIADLSLTAKCKTSFNDSEFDFSLMKNYAALFNKPLIVHKENNIEVCLMDTEVANVVSFANTKLTRQGGTHVEGVYKALAPLLEMLSKKKKITLRDIKPQLSFVLNVQVTNPRWADQMKSGLKYPEVKVSFPQAFLKKMLNWDLVRRLCSASENKIMAQTDGKKKRHLKVENLQDANMAGTKEADLCSLYVIEGLSASCYAEYLRDYLKDRDHIGIYPLRGKMLNVTNANNLRIAENKVICKLKEILGLREGVNYGEEKNFRTLRYGHLVILTDSDTDGYHCCGLLLNFFYCRFRSLLHIGYIKYLRTPIVRLKKGSEKLSFFTEGEFEEWLINNKEKSKGYQIKYCKGLGSSSPIEVKDDSLSPRIVVYIYDDNAPEAMELAFNKSLSDSRKEWIERFQEECSNIFSIEGVQEQPISDFINHELVRFSLDNMLRSIPRMMDGLKISQRKILWGAMNHWKTWHSSKKFSSVKVKNLSSEASAFTCYKHGEDILAETVILLAQDYTGSNNLPYFVQDGMFGTRAHLGENSANPRYSHVYPEEWWQYVYKKEDEGLLTILEDEGQMIEPAFFLPIIPMCLVNGQCGIGSGYSCYIPNYNVVELIRWLEKKILGEEVEEPLPWYKGFLGDILIKGKTMITQGRFYTQRETTYITEIPIGKSLEEYSTFAASLVEDKTIKDYRINSTTNTPNIELYGMKNPTLKKLKLEKSFGLGNMVLLDVNEKPKRYENVTEILEDFYEQRLFFYGKRKEYCLQEIEGKIIKIGAKIKLILYVIEGKIHVNKVKKEEVKRQLLEHDIPVKLLKEVNLFNLTYEQVEKLLKDKENLENSYTSLQEKPPANIWLEELIEFKEFYIKKEQKS